MKCLIILATIVATVVLGVVKDCPVSGCTGKIDCGIWTVSASPSAGTKNETCAGGLECNAWASLDGKCAEENCPGKINDSADEEICNLQVACGDSDSGSITTCGGTVSWTLNSTHKEAPEGGCTP